MVVKVVVICLTGEKKAITLCDTEEEFKRLRVCDLKTMIERDIVYPESECRLVFLGMQLQDHELLSEYKIRHMSEIHLILNLRGGGEQHSADGRMGDRTGKNMSKEQLYLFDEPDVDPPDQKAVASCCII